MVTANKALDKTPLNPLLAVSQLPPFERILPKHVLPAIETLIAACRQGVASLIEAGDAAALLAGEEELLTQVDNAWTPVVQLYSVLDGQELREAYQAALASLSAFYAELAQDPGRYRAYQALRNDREAWARLDTAQRRVVEHQLRDARLAGVALSSEVRERYRWIQSRITQLSADFQQRLQDATDAWSMHFEAASSLRGLPESALDQARQRALSTGKTGYMINLEYPCYHTMLTYVEDRALRETVYRAYHTRASDQGEYAHHWDNGDNIVELLSLRSEMAKLLGFDSYVDYSLEPKMVRSGKDVRTFLEGLVKRARPRAIAELGELTAFAQAQGGPEKLAVWDIAFWSEKLREQRFAISDEALRPYLAVPRVLAGMMNLFGKLFGVRFRVRSGVEVWHKHVEFYDVLQADGRTIGGFYIDLYARKGKRGGAWMGDCRSLHHTQEGGQQPVAFLNCNFTAPNDDRPSLLNHKELKTLFHEFGHSLHHLLTAVPYPRVGGINGVEWDAVELPSQLLENWCWEEAALASFARHVKTDAAIPAQLIESLQAARPFQSGLSLIRQLELALLDYHLHSDPSPDVQIARIERKIRDQVVVVSPPAENRFLNGFSHIFSGSYAAGYFSYLWAEQLAADAYSRFQEDGIFNTETGADYRREILEVGASRPASESFLAFRGRAPELNPLLRQYGIADA